jgi:hypothetical protein
MPPRRLPLNRAVLALAALLAVGLGVAVTARGASEGSLRSKIHSGKVREQALGDAAAHLGRLERASAREVAIIEGRLAGAQADLNAAQRRLTTTQTRLAAERKRLARLRKRLAESRALLTDLLRQRYMSTRPDLVSVVLDADGFADLLERMEFLQRIEDSDTAIVDVVRAARHDAGRETVVLTRLERRRQAETVAVRSPRPAPRVSPPCVPPAPAAAPRSARCASSSPTAPAPPSTRPAPAAHGPFRGRSSSVSPAARTCHPTARAPRAITR